MIWPMIVAAWNEATLIAGWTVLSLGVIFLLLWLAMILVALVRGECVLTNHRWEHVKDDPDGFVHLKRCKRCSTIYPMSGEELLYFQDTGGFYQ